MKVLITGSHGFVGKHVVEYLKAHTTHELICPTRQELNIVEPNVACVHTDEERPTYYLAGARSIAMYMLSQGTEAVIHLAARCGGIGVNKDNPGLFMFDNLQMGINIIEACRYAQIKKLVNLSTVCSYPKFTPIPFKESDIWNGYPEETNAPYGIAKKVCGELATAYHKQYGLNVTNLVPVNMAGEYDHFDLYSSHVLPALIRKFEEEELHAQALLAGEIEIVGSMTDPQIPNVVLWGTGSASRELLYAGDCARAIALALEKDTGPDPINLGTGHEITIKDLAEKVKTIGGYHASITWDNTKPDGQPRRCLDTSRAQELLDWEATTSIDETIAKTIEWYRNGK